MGISQTETQANRKLSRFLEAKRSTILEIKKSLQYRNYESLGDKSVSNFLRAAVAVTDDYEDATDLFVKTDFLKALVRAWEIADATNKFNHAAIGSNHRDIRTFSSRRSDDLSSIPDALTEMQRDYYREVARSSLIDIAEACRGADSKQCREKLTRLIGIVSTRIRNADSYPCDGTLAQFYYYLAKVERIEGDLFRSEKSIARATHLYLKKADRLSTEQKGNLEQDSALAEKILNVTLRAGVVEVARAWLYFSQRRYDAAKNTAQLALIILSQSSDWLSSAAARLLVAAIARVTADDVDKLIKAIKSLRALRTLFEKKEHFRLQARTEHELLLALIMLDGLLDGSTRVAEKLKDEDPLVGAELIIERGAIARRRKGRWEALYYAQKSRVLRRRAARSHLSEREFTSALEAANEGLACATRAEIREAQIETLITRGEVLYQQAITSHRSRELDKNKNPLEHAKAVSAPSRRRDNSFRFFSSTERGVTTINLDDAKECFDQAREDFSQALKWVHEKTSQGAYAEFAAICHLYLARIAIRSSQFGLEAFTDAEYQLYEFRRLGPFEHAWLRRLEAKVNAELERRDDWSLLISSNKYDDADIELKDFLIRRITMTNPGIRKYQIAGILGIDPETLRTWKKEIDKFRERRDNENA